MGLKRVVLILIVTFVNVAHSDTHTPLFLYDIESSHPRPSR